MRLKLFFLCLLTTMPGLFFHQFTYAQKNGLVVDRETGKGIPYVNIYSKKDNQVFGTVSNERGEFTVNFNFKMLIFSHLNYEQIEISNFTDTIFLEPKTEILKEIFIMNKQPEWIAVALKRILDKKAENYQLLDKKFSYNYKTYTLNDSNGYAFSSKGNLIIPQLKKNVFMIDAKDNIVRYKDKTAGVDFSNLQRMLYQNFINNADRSFISENIFNQDFSYKSDNKSIVKLLFSSEKFRDDAGYLVVDTLNNLILEIERNSGTDFNIKTQTSAFLRSAAKNTLGFTYNDWITQTYTKYEKIGKSCYISASKYKFYMKTTTHNKKINSDYFTSIESELYLSPVNQNDNAQYLVIPQPFYLLPVMTKKRRIEEERLRNVKVEFGKF